MLRCLTALAIVWTVFLLSACGGGSSDGSNESAGVSSKPPPSSAPSAPIITVSLSSGVPGVSITESATSTDPQNTPLTYSWALGDGATATGASVTHTYTTEGQFSPRVTVTNQAGLTASATVSSPIVIAYLPVPNFQIFPTNQGHFLGQTFSAQTSEVTTDSNGLPITFQWAFGDGATGTGSTALHVYASPGTYTLVLTATNSAGHSSVAQGTVQVFAPTPQPAPVSDAFAPYCAGPFCGAAGASSYSGSGIGVWRYHNSSVSPATLDIDISGVHGGQSASLVFTNGTKLAASTLPDSGTLVASATSLSPLVVSNDSRVRIGVKSANEHGTSPEGSNLDAAHAIMLQRNLESARAFTANVGSEHRATVSREIARANALGAPPALGTARVWYDTYSTAVPYNMQVGATCQLSTGRNAVFWLDSTQVSSGTISPARIQFILDGFCGAGGSYARQIALTGDVWGPAAAGTGFIEDSAGGLQDLNIVIPGVPSSTDWGGYFNAGNLNPASNGSGSNGSLAVFLNANLLTRSPDDQTAFKTLVHELKHHINFYQRTVARHVIHPIWLEETSAMLSEDLFTLPYIGYNAAELRHDGYVFSGGGIGYLDWTNPEGNSYNQGGSFGAFLHRRYGLDIDRRLVDTCADDGTPAGGYTCLDSIILQKGGYGFEDEFSRQGASIFGAMGKGGFPFGFGYASIVTEGIYLQAFGAASVNYPPSGIVPREINQFLATMHTYNLDYIATGQSVFKRHGVVVPAGTTLILVIQ